MRLADTNYDNSETGCCARVDLAQWEGKTLEWKDKPFLKDHIRSFLHIPLNFGDILVAVDKTVAGVRMETLSGTFFTKVFEGPFRDTGKWMEQMEAYVKEKGHKVERIYSYYATCPKCAKHFGANRVVLFAKAG